MVQNEFRAIQQIAVGNYLKEDLFAPFDLWQLGELSAINGTDTKLETYLEKGYITLEWSPGGDPDFPFRIAKLTPYGYHIAMMNSSIEYRLKYIAAANLARKKNIDSSLFAMYWLYQLANPGAKIEEYCILRYREEMQRKLEKQ